MTAAPRPPFADRVAAGEALGAALQHLAGEGVLVLALPRGGVPVAAPVARRLGAALDVVVVRKLRTPGHPELAMGAVAAVGDRIEVFRYERVASRRHRSPDAFEAAVRSESEELRARQHTLRGDRPAPALEGRTVVVVDDGVATGSTMQAALAAVRARGPARLVAAVPVGSASACRDLAAHADEVVCLVTPEPFTAVGAGYVDFSETADDEVQRLLSSD